MGVIIDETITLAIGLTVTNPYASVGENDIKVEKNVNFSQSGDGLFSIEYVIDGRFTMWVSPELRVSRSEDIGSFQVEVKSDTPPTGNIYELLYNKLKTMKTCKDSI